MHKVNKIEELTTKKKKTKCESKENQPDNSRVKPTAKAEPIKLLEKKDFSHSQKQELRTVDEIEKNLWKNNISKEPRSKKDFLDITNEDFSQNKTLSVEGKEIIPSNFNIFRDSLKNHSEQLLEKLNENLPDMNLEQLESQSEAD